MLIALVLRTCRPCRNRYNRIEDSTIWGNGIGIHSACNNMRVTGSDLHANTITGILIDGGAAIDIVGNLIEGNAGRVAPTHPSIHPRTPHLLTYGLTVLTGICT
jgi:hypothetical protein